MRDADSQQIGVRLQIEARHRLETLARLSNVPLSELVRQAIAMYVEDGHDAWHEAQRMWSGKQGLTGERESTPLEVKLYGEWLLSRPADLRTLLLHLGDDLRGTRQDPPHAARHLQLLETNPLGGWTAEFLEPIPTSLPPSEQAERGARSARLVDVNANMLRILGVSQREEVIGAPMIAMFNLADANTYDAAQQFARDGYTLIGASVSAVTPAGRCLPLIVSMVGTVESDHLVRLRGVAQALAPQDGCSVPEGLESHLPQGMWCVQLARPLPATEPPSSLIPSIYEAGRLTRCNQVFAHLCGVEGPEKLEGESLAEVLPPDQPRNRMCFDEFIRSEFRLPGRECVMTTASGATRLGRLRMCGHVLEDSLLCIHGCIEDLTHLVR